MSKKPNVSFNAIVFTGEPEKFNKGFVKYRAINSLTRFKTFINNKYPYWKFTTLYDKYDNSKTIIKRSEWI